MEGIIHKRKVEKIRNFLGIDPGLKGGLALIASDGKILDMMKMPVRKDKQIDHDRLYKFISEITNVHIILERAVSFGMGSKGAFNYGRGFAAIEISIELTGNKYDYVYPQVWTRLLHGDLFGRKDLKAKEKSLIVAERLFDLREVPKSGTGALHDGIIDALLLAEYGRRAIQLN